MSNERPSPDSNSVTDPVVSQAYRETADERVPAELDRAVLSRAASAVRPRYARSILWLRPLAWTATIGLCLVIVLELTRAPLPEPAVFETPAAVSDAPAEKTLPDEIGDARTAEPPRQDLDAFTNVPVSDEQPARSEASLPASQPAPAFAEPDVDIRSSSRGSDSESARTSAPSPAESFEIKNLQLLRQAEDLARSHSDNLVETEQPVRHSIAAKRAAMSSIAHDCDEDATATPAMWLECIENLEKAGRVEAAQRERERLLSEFPRYELP